MIFFDVFGGGVDRDKYVGTFAGVGSPFVMCAIFAIDFGNKSAAGSHT